ncbi:MAG: IS4 family transposase, partial [Betaproteobacteria bacterium]
IQTAEFLLQKGRDPKGDWQIATTAKALRELAAQGLWTLPKPMVHRKRVRKTAPTRLSAPVKRATNVPNVVSEVQGLRLVEVADQEHLKLWNELMIGEHPLHDARMVGRQFRYLIASDHGWLGGLGFGSCALYLEGRDQWIGWSDAQRTAHLGRVINMTRFLIRPNIRCQNLASHVLGLCARRIAGDFERRYGLRPWLMESFVDTSQYEGTCYQAANWLKVGQTKGRGRNGARDAGKSIKDIYLYSLVDDFHALVEVERFPHGALEPVSGLDGAGWAEQEFGACELGDERLNRRLVEIVGQQAAHPGASFAEASGGVLQKLKNYYYLLNNEREELNVDSMLATHRAQTLRRMKGEELVLIIQDTMDMNFSTRRGCEGLGQIGTNQTGAKSRGLRMHSAFAVNESGLPLGVLRLHGYAPEPAKDKDPQRPIEEKDSHRWLETYEDAAKVAELLPDTRIISVADREGDMFELFDLRRRQPGAKADLLVRSKNDRCLEGTDEKLFAELAQAPVATRLSLPIPRQREKIGKRSKPGRPGLAARMAEVEVRYKEVALLAPKTTQLRHRPPLTLWAVYVVEPRPPAGAAAVEWLLLTTGQVASAKQALKCIQWYCRRWRIEEWHRVMKSACKILEHQNHSAVVLLRSIALDAVIAWRIMLLTLLGREMPELPADELFSPDEIEVLEVLTKKNTLAR